jgi:hypothetical protein
MKKLLIFALLLCTKNLFAQKDTVGLNVPFADNTVAYERVFNVSNANKSLLYANAGIWLAETHPYGGNTQLTLKDDNLSRVVGRVKYTVVTTEKILWENNYSNYVSDFTIQIDCRDNQYRVRIYNIQNEVGTTYIPTDELMQSLIKSKSYALDGGGFINTKALKQLFQTLNTAMDNVMTDINKSMLQDNAF